MSSKEFFFLVATMRDAQRAYFEKREQRWLRRCRALENDVDAEIRRVLSIIEPPAPA